MQSFITPSGCELMYECEKYIVSKLLEILGDDCRVDAVEEYKKKQMRELDTYLEDEALKKVDWFWVVILLHQIVLTPPFLWK